MFRVWAVLIDTCMVKHLKSMLDGGRCAFAVRKPLHLAWVSAALAGILLWRDLASAAWFTVQCSGLVQNDMNWVKKSTIPAYMQRKGSAFLVLSPLVHLLEVVAVPGFFSFSDILCIMQPCISFPPSPWLYRNGRILLPWRLASGLLSFFHLTMYLWDHFMLAHGAISHF